nr:MAG TPA: hypothetical protein [Caudoviricetes sp.]
MYYICKYIKNILPLQTYMIYVFRKGIYNI